jgi:hypothetical protein
MKGFELMRGAHSETLLQVGDHSPCHCAINIHGYVTRHVTDSSNHQPKDVPACVTLLVNKIPDVYCDYTKVHRSTPI